jgi:hypothetical protein
MNLSRTLLLFLPLASVAQTIHGTVQNGTTGRLEPLREVILFTTLGEQARATTNDNGEFQIDTGGHLDFHSTAVLEVLHEGVRYFQSVRPGHPTNVTVYEASSEANGVSGRLSILQFQTKDKLLQVTELHALDNASNPPTSRVDPNNLVLSIPVGALVQSATVSEPDGGSLRLMPVVIPGTTQYRIDFPIKPGLTKYAISYLVPYSGDIVFHRQVQYPTKRVGVIVPGSMHFRSLGAKVFHAVVDQPGVREQVLDGLTANQPFAFELSGTGGLARSFRPLSPAEPPASKASALSSAYGPYPGPPANIASPTHPRASPVGYQLVLAIGTLLVVGLFLWRRMLRRNLITDAASPPGRDTRPAA